jgi:SpoIID/LytB domain protein
MRCMVALLLMMLFQSEGTLPFRVQVFPHWGDLPVPQGREAVVSKVLVTSAGNCSQYLAAQTEKNQWIPLGNPILSSQKFLLSNTRLYRMARYFFHTGKAFYFKCEKPFKVNREKNLESFTYEGDFVAVFDVSEKGKPVRIINIIDPENYLKGVVPSEVSSSWPMEALKAQAVAARSYAWWQVLKARLNPNSAYDLDDTIGYQAYLGLTRRTAPTDQAVDLTSRTVMRYQGKVIKAYFSADSGGASESAENVFGEDLPYCKSRKEEYDLSKTRTNWQKTMTLAEISQALGDSVRSISVLNEDRSESGRVKFLTVYFENGQVEKISGTRIRRLFKLRSTLFEVRPSPASGVESFQLDGRGFGHGVGMAQVGAKEYASQLGWTFDQILKFYYDGITLEPIYEQYSE